jgi:hypothetical protein
MERGGPGRTRKSAANGNGGPVRKEPAMRKDAKKIR